MRMKIAMVSEHADPAAVLGGTDAGGQNVHVGALSAALAERGHSVTVYTRLTGRETRRRAPLSPGVTVRRLPAGPVAPLPKDELLPFMPEFGDQLARLWQQEPPDIVHAHFWMSGLAALAGAAGLPVPVVQTFHALGTVKARHQGAADTSPAERVRLELSLAHSCHQVIATCRDEASELRLAGVPASQVSIVPCGVDTSAFTPDGLVARRNGRPRLLALGRLVERKGVATVIAALASLPGVELVVAGGPGQPDLASSDDYRRLRLAATVRGVADRVIFTGSVARPDVPALIRSADAVVCVPWYEPFGIVPLEAMACGVPVVASAVGGLADSVADQKTGCLVPARDPAALAAALAQLLAEPERRAAFGAAGVERARRRYSWQRVAAQTEMVYLRLAADARRDVLTFAGRSLAAGAS
jgi:glycosyltransferase involved in cell wall biosynthesis